MKKKILSFLLGLCLCISFALPLYAIDGPINADDDAELVTPTLEVTDVPTGAVAVAHSLDTNQTYYYSVNGSFISSDNEEVLHEPGWMPETYSIDGVIGNDNRELVQNTRQHPFSAIAFLEIFFPYGGVQGGTAIMIGPNAALTAAHNLYCGELGGWAVYVRVTPAVTGDASSPTNPYGYTSARELVISVPAFEDEAETDGVDCDWGVIRLNSNIGNNSGFLGFQYIAPSLEATSVMISGYPVDLNSLGDTCNQYMHSGRIVSDISSQIIAGNNRSYENRLFTYKIDASGGQSGAPILYYSNGAYQIIGIHSSGSYEIDNDNEYVYYRNNGCGLTSELFNFLWAYKNNS